MGPSKMYLVFLLMTSAVWANPLLNPDSLGQRSEKFAADVYKIISSKSGNSLFCPISMQSLLALIQSGANGRTLEQISKALHLSQDKTETQQMFRQLVTRLRSIQNITLDSANKIYVREDFKISENFKNVATETFEAEFENVNFAEKTKVVSSINKWVSEKTSDKITSIVTEEDLSTDVALLLLNALYFNGSWKQYFDENFTVPSKFFVNDTHSIKLDMMTQEDVLEYAANDYAQFVDIPYANEDLVMSVILPKNKNGLAEVEAHIDEALKVQDTYPSEVVLILPKFKIESTVDFNDVLTKLGMIDAFTTDADLTGISADGNHLHITKVLQKSYIKVSEQGTEAAAIGAGIVTDRISAPPRIVFRASHPFLFVIRQRSTGIIEFLGRFTGA